jgi:hypothetical protein
MQKFLLLRNNKQTGPYSVEELEQMGLKAYDLIWVNGKSAAWRYPGEIDELKSFAPPVEEQPYDRFYKKPSEETQKKAEAPKSEAVKETAFSANGSSNGNGSANGSSNGNGYAAPINPQPKKVKEYKRVFVTLPNAGVNKRVELPIQETPVVPPKNVEPIPSVAEKQKPQKIEAYKDETNGHSSIDIYYTKKRGFSSKKTFLVSAFVIGILALIGLGMFIGLSLQQPNKEAGKQETERVYRVSDKETDIPTRPVSHIDNKIATDDRTLQSNVPNADSSLEVPASKKPKTNHIPSLKNQLKDLEQKSNVKPIDSSLLNLTPSKTESEKKVVEKKAPDLAKFVSVSNNDFQVGPFGGISRLALTVHNSSDYDIDLVVVNLEYLKVNKEVYKTETLYFKDVNANSSVTVDAPKSSRGNKINYKISLITSKDRMFHASSD